MRVQFLTHLLDAVSALAQPRRIVVLGSSSLLPLHPQLGEPGQALELSLDADLLLEPDPAPARARCRLTVPVQPETAVTGLNRAGLDRPAGSCDHLVRGSLGAA